MKIPTPKLERIPYNMHGLSGLKQIIHKWKHPPTFRLLEDYIITLNDGTELIFWKGFVIDGASVPRLLWPFISPTGPLLEGSVLHDFLYQHGYFLARRQSLKDKINCKSARLYSQYEHLFGDYYPIDVGAGQRCGDVLLRNITIEKHGATVDAWRAYYALRAFGHKAYNKYRQLGPGAYNSNSLGLPGLLANGSVGF